MNRVFFQQSHGDWHTQTLSFIFLLSNTARVMKNLLNNSEIEIPCENCGRETKKTIGWIKTHNKFTCGCGAEITLDAKQFKAEIAKAERSLAGLDATLKKLGK